MTNDEPVHRTTDEERDRAAAVHSVDDETRVHSTGDETDLVQGAGGELRRPEQPPDVGVEDTAGED